MVRSVCLPPFAKSREGWGTPSCGSVSGRLGHPPREECFYLTSPLIEPANRKVTHISAIQSAGGKPIFFTSAR